MSTAALLQQLTILAALVSVIAAIVIAACLTGAWIATRAQKGLSVLPSFPKPVKAAGPKEEPNKAPTLPPRRV